MARPTIANNTNIGRLIKVTCHALPSPGRFKGGGFRLLVNLLQSSYPEKIRPRHMLIMAESQGAATGQSYRSAV